MPISKTTVIEDRRARVYELAAKGLSAREITERLTKQTGIEWSRRTISKDMKWWKDRALQIVSETQDNIAYEYNLVLENHYLIRKKLWELMDKVGDDDEEDNNNKNIALKQSLCHSLLEVNYAIVDCTTAGDIVKREAERIKKEAEEDLERAKEHLKQLPAVNSRDEPGCGPLAPL